MQFIANGPEIPNALLQAHDEGRVVFFCGAGISYPAGLPGFQGLVDEIYLIVGTTRSAIENAAYKREQFDVTLDLLERRLPGGRISVRNALAQALQPNWRRKGATDTHTALLQLARTRDGSVRLVTTNFDRIFERAAKRSKQPFHAYAAPMLPIPKSSRWNGVVYLHGLLPEKANDSALNRLVLTSGDFGLAYLTERWAARFVSELFRNYVVCFVGYGINDPVVRYMMDALAADRMLGEVAPQAYALGDCGLGQEGVKAIEWEAKGVTPILYQAPEDSQDHSALHNTMTTWAATHRDGVLGKERIVVDFALARPSGSTQEDDFVGRMLWALSDESGLPAMRFADFNPAPPIEWLEVFAEDRYQHSDLNRFGVAPQAKVNEKLRFSLVKRPVSCERAPRMALASRGSGSSDWDDVMFHLARWVVRHLNDPTLILWLTEQGAELHPRLARLIEHEVDRFAGLEREGKTTELNDIRAASPNAIPGPLMQILWRMLLTGRVKSLGSAPELYGWTNRFGRDGLTATGRLELRNFLEAKIVLKKPFRWESKETSAAEFTNLKQLVGWEMMLSANHVLSTLPRFDNPSWRAALPSLLSDFQQLLRDALDLLQELGDADERSDRSHWHLQSISPHPQNAVLRDWVTLIELLRDAWLATLESNPKRARQIALAWFDLPYPTFKRLALFAANRVGCIQPAEWCQWLTADAAWWLWSAETRLETMRLLTAQSGKLMPSDRTLLESAVLAGPLRPVDRAELEPEKWQSLIDRSIWEHLAKLREGRGQLGDAAAKRMDELTTANPEWKLVSNERDGFSFWTSGTGDADFEERRDIDVAPRKRKELVDWLKRAPPVNRPFYEDTWTEVCCTRFFHSLLALCDLAEEGIWPAQRWQEALYAWGQDGSLIRSWRFAAPLVQRMPNSVMLAIVYSVSRWIDAVSKSVDKHEAILLNLCERLLDFPLDPSAGIVLNEEPNTRPVTEAINHPAGHATQALLNLWLRRSPKDHDSLPVDIEPLFTQLCDTRVRRFRHARVMLAANLISLFRVDRFWTERHLLPFFDWAGSAAEAKAAWDGFLWSPRLFRPLLVAFKSQFLGTAIHYDELGEHKGQFADVLTRAALGSVDGYTAADFQTAIGLLPQDGLERVAYVLVQVLESSADQREDYWKNRVRPFWHGVWPKSRKFASDNLVDSLARLCIAADRAFPEALSMVVHWLRPIEHPQSVVRTLHLSQLSGRFPDAALQLLDAILSDQPWVPSDLGECLDAIAQTKPDLRNDPRCQKLDKYLRRRSF